MHDVTQVLSNIEAGDASAMDQLLPLVYDELRKMATAKLAGEQRGHTLQATALVHEAYIRLLRSAGKAQVAIVNETESAPGVTGWRTREHFFRAAAVAMRHILVDHARRKNANKRNGRLTQRPLVDVMTADAMSASDLLDLDDALNVFSKRFPDHAKLVELQFFTGLTRSEAAACLGISSETARRYWLFTRAWLFDRLSNETADPH